MKNIKAVIGSNFGDEGKGLMTDYFSSQSPNGIVVRFNGGSQAGHTVVSPESIRHIFSHLGSGTLAGLPSYLSEFFIINPMIFKKEYEGLHKKSISPNVYIDYNCIVTTPYDMLINQIVENNRGMNRHGSCGLGINETIKRNKVVPIKFKDLYDEKALIDKLLYIRNEYIIIRLNELGVASIPPGFVELLKNDNIIFNYLKDVSFLLNKVKVTDIDILKKYKNIIFEGAQGLLLDQSSKYFPHVTPSNTGMENVKVLLDVLNYGNEDIEIIYVTRNYLTRHGAGSFETEIESKPYANIIDLTNVSNQYQGQLRFGILNIDVFKETISKDLNFAQKLNYRMSLAITCLDQIEDKVTYIFEGKNYEENPDIFIANLSNVFCPSKMYLSYGLTRNTIKIQ